MSRKLRWLYGYSKKDNSLVIKVDVLSESLNADMMMRDYEKAMVQMNPQLVWKVVIV